MVFLALLLAHLLGDFPLQPGKVAANKGRRLWASGAHFAIHYGTAWACLLLFTHIAFRSITAQAVILGYLLVHLAIDLTKHALVVRRIVPDGAVIFLADQAAHVVTVVAATGLLTGAGITEFFGQMHLSPMMKFRILTIATIYVGTIFGGGYLVRYLTKSLASDITTENAAQLKNAGLYIGWVERFLVLTAIAVQAPALVGLILTGKSIARFPELKESRFAEYFLIGTLSSTALAVVGGLVISYMVYGTVSLK